MATIRIVLRGEACEKDGIPIYCRITHGGKSAFISIDEKIPAKYWVKKAEQPVKTYSGGGIISKKTFKIKEELKIILNKLKDEGKTITAKKIKQVYCKGNETPIDFFGLAEKYLASIDVYGTRKGVKSVFDKLKKFHKLYYDNEPLHFNDIDYAYLKGFENYLKKKLNNQPNTIGSALKKIRMVYNEAIRLGIANRNQYPFGYGKYQIKLVPTYRDWLSQDELSKLENFDIDTPKYRLYKNAFVFSANVGGLRPSDILKLKWENFDGAQIDIVMHKTKRQVIVEVNDIGHEILEHQKQTNPPVTPKDLIFPILKVNDFSNHEVLDRAIASALTLVNTGLKIISDKAGIKPLTLGMGRHTFGTHAVLNDMQIPVLSKIMGHSTINQTMVYVKITGKDIKDEMQKMNKRKKGLDEII